MPKSVHLETKKAARMEAARQSASTEMQTFEVSSVRYRAESETWSGEDLSVQSSVSKQPMGVLSRSGSASEDVRLQSIYSSGREVPAPPVELSARPEKRRAEHEHPGVLQDLGDGCYRWGDCALSRIPRRARKFLEDIAPEDITKVDGGLEKTCCLLVFLQVAIVVSFILWALVAYQTCISKHYLALTEEDGTKCDSVSIAISDEYQLDDHGFWSTASKWSFSDTMVKGVFREMVTTNDDWRGVGSGYRNGDSAGFFEVLRKWNLELENKGYVYTAVSLVTAAGAANSNGTLEAQIIASPISLMDTDVSEVMSSCACFYDLLY